MDAASRDSAPEPPPPPKPPDDVPFFSSSSLERHRHQCASPPAASVQGGTHSLHPRLNLRRLSQLQLRRPSSPLTPPPVAIHVRSGCPAAAPAPFEPAAPSELEPAPPAPPEAPKAPAAQAQKGPFLGGLSIKTTSDNPGKSARSCRLVSTEQADGFFCQPPLQSSSLG